MAQKVVLIILDGLGIGEPREYNPFYAAHPKNLIELGENFPLTSLQSGGIAVGLPWGEPGNCETGHLILGAGKIIYQNYPLITMAIRDGSFFQNEAINKALDFTIKNNSRIHFVGLLSSGVSEASKEHLQALVKLAQTKNVNFALHLFADGEDSPPQSFLKLLKDLPEDKLGSIIGRYYALDNKSNPNIAKRAYDCLIGEAQQTPNWKELIINLYAKDINDNYLPPILIDQTKTIQEGDAIIFFNFREDNIRTLIKLFINPNEPNIQRKIINNLFMTTMTECLPDDYNLPVAFKKQKVSNPLSAVLSKNNKVQLKISENSKYPLITLYFNGMHELPYENEFRVSIPSNPSLNIIENPQMMARAITDRLIEAIQNNSFDFILANYGNLDILGHVGNFDAALKGVQIIDLEIEKIVRAALKNNITVLITSDHGNIEQIINPQTAEKDTEHNLNPVPFYLIDQRFKGRKFPNFKNIKYEPLGFLSDIAPTILELFNISTPLEMDGQSLIKNLF